jgi:tRNA A-37 threonylcarbamoyl transferase component Bud32
MEAVFYDRIIETPSKEVRQLLQECADENEKLMRSHSAIHEYIRQNIDRLTHDAVASPHHTVIVSKTESRLPHALRWSVSLNKSSGGWTSTCYITQGELGRGGEAVVKEVIVCSAKVFQRMAIRHLLKAEKEQQPSPLSTEVQRSRQVEQMQFVDVLTKRGVPRLVQMKQLLYLGKDGVMKEGMAMECYSSYYDVVIASTGEMLPKMIRIAALLGETLYYLHKQGFVHRDLKLENILVDDHYVPFLGDFGLTRRSGAITGARGTVGYRPPEILETAGERKIPADPRSDLWSFGVLLYVSFLKTNPFETIQIEHREAVLAGDIKRRDGLFREFCRLVEQERENLLTGQYSHWIDIDLSPVIADLLELSPANRLAEDTMLTLLQRVAKRYAACIL